MINKTFRFVGFSTNGDKTQVRYANSKSRASVLKRNGHTAIYLQDAGEALGQTDLVDLLLDGVDRGDFAAEPEAVTAILAEARRLGFAL